MRYNTGVFLLFSFTCYLLYAAKHQHSFQDGMQSERLFALKTWGGGLFFVPYQGYCFSTCFVLVPSVFHFIILSTLCADFAKAMSDLWTGYPLKFTVIQPSQKKYPLEFTL